MKSNIKNMTYCGIFAALIIVLTMISIPMPTGIPITLQTFAVALCGFFLGSRLGALSVAVYLALGAIGLPVFSGFAGGIGKIAGVTGGFMWGFVIMVLLCGIMNNRSLKGKGKAAASIVFGVLGLICCHILGVIQFSLVSGNGLIEAAMIASVPYLVKDVISVAAAFGVSVLLKTALKKANLPA